MNKDQVINLIKAGIETELCDFKRQYYVKAKNSDLVKDIVAFANNPSNEDKCIIFGVDDKTKETYDIDISTIPDISTIENLLSEKVEPFVSVDLQSCDFGGKTFAYLTVSGKNTNRPYVIKNDYDKIVRGDIYIRKGTSNQKANRADIDKMYRLNRTKKIEIFDDYIIVEPFHIDGVGPDDYTYGKISVEITNHSDKPFVLSSGKIEIRNEYDTIDRIVNDILPNHMISDNPISVQANSQIVTPILFQFESRDCVSLRFTDEGYMNYPTTAKTVFYDTNGIEYHSTEKRVAIFVKGDILHKVRLMYAEFRKYLKKNEKALLLAISNKNQTELNRLLEGMPGMFILLQPPFCPPCPDIENKIAADMVRTAIKADNIEALSKMKEFGLSNEFVECVINGE